MPEEPELDVFLVSHNHLELTIRAITALYNYTDKSFKITVVDDSTDETPAYLARFSKEHRNMQALYPVEEITSFQQALNFALEETNCPIICVMVNSITVEPHWLDSAFRIMKEREDCGMVGFKILNTHGTIQCTAIMGMYENGIMAVTGKEEAGHRCTYISQVPAVGGCLFLIRRKAIDMLDDGEFDVKTYPYGFRGWDDIDLCLSVRSKGWDIIYCGYGAAYHIDSPTKRVGEKNKDFMKEMDFNREIFKSRWDFKI